MQVFSAQATAQALHFPDMLKQMEALFAAGASAPLRHHHTMPNEHRQDAVLLLMPAWEGDAQYMGVKIVNVNPDNGQRDLPAIHASYLLADKTTGEHLALLNGSVLTAKRTAAASALGAKYVANPAAKSLLVVGAGRVAQELPAAFSSAFPLQTIKVWNRNPEKAANLVKRLQATAQWSKVELCKDLQAGVEQADIISCATLAREPVIKGEWLQAGQHLDLLGAFTPEMRETDDRAMQRARVYIDTSAALKECGELLMPLASGALQTDDIQSDLYQLCQRATSQFDARQCTLFKGVGHAIEDLACAISAWYKLS